MDIKPIKTEADHRAALAEISRLMDLPEEALPDADGDRLEVLAVLVEDYERQHHPIAPVDPIEAIEFMMGEKGMGRADLEPLIGSRGRVSEVLNRKRALSINMIRALSEGLCIPPDVLLAPYDLRPEPPATSRTKQTKKAIITARKRAN
jgi:HTH-type transcriptional regulator/antitoxin HigA